MPCMTPEDEARVRELPAMIANEKDREKVITLAAELDFILGKPRPVDEKPPRGIREDDPGLRVPLRGA
jgi:hypothetical protein